LTVDANFHFSLLFGLRGPVDDRLYHFSRLKTIYWNSDK
jgi:hypothetical protein